MSNENTKIQPTHRIYQVTGDGKNSVWTPFAAAFPHRDGRGFNILVPFIGKVVMREIDAKPEQDEVGA